MVSEFEKSPYDFNIRNLMRSFMSAMQKKHGTIVKKLLFFGRKALTSSFDSGTIPMHCR